LSGDPVEDEGGREEIMSDASLHERRFHTTDPALEPGSRQCRECFRIVDLEPEYLEPTDMYVYVRCPYCSHSFPVRHSDAEELLERHRPAS
jgi:DNA-directed RNA polymerase subunit RPC12/RpoP